MSAVRTAAAVIAALALVAIALFTYQSAQADRGAACWAETTARNVWTGTIFDAYWATIEDVRPEAWAQRAESIMLYVEGPNARTVERFGTCEALR